MGVIALAFFDPRSSRGSSGATWVRNLKKCLFSNGAQNGLKFWFLLLQCPPLLSDFKGGSVLSRYTYGVKWWKWGVLRQINFGLQIFSDLQKKIIFATTYKFRKALSRRNFEFRPYIKIEACFQKSFKFQSQNLGIRLWTPQFSKIQFFCNNSP